MRFSIHEGPPLAHGSIQLCLEWSPADMDYFVDTMVKANALWATDRHAEALTLLEASVLTASQTEEATWLRLQACLIARATSNPALVESLCGQILSYDPENVLAIYNLADAALIQGKADLSARYALQAHTLISRSSPERDRVLLDLLESRWPEIQG
jgi:hypothetical protein